MTSLFTFRIFTFLALTTTLALSQQTVTKTATTVTASTIPLSPSYTDPSKFQSTILNSTNLYRTQHSSPPLTWNTTLSSIANTWAAQCLWRHSGDAPGENLALGLQNTTAAVDAWGNERAHYNFNKPTGFSEETGHFTQLVWGNTTTVGCAYQDCSGRNGLEGVLLACEYWPPGNVRVEGGKDQWAEYKDNVRKQIKTGTKSGVAVTIVSSRWTIRGVAGIAVLLAGTVF